MCKTRIIYIDKTKPSIYYMTTTSELSNDNINNPSIEIENE